METSKTTSSATFCATGVWDLNYVFLCSMIESKVFPYIRNLKIIGLIKQEVLLLRSHLITSVAQCIHFGRFIGKQVQVRNVQNEPPSVICQEKYKLMTNKLASKMLLKWSAHLKIFRMMRWLLNRGKATSDRWKSFKNKELTKVTVKLLRVSTVEKVLRVTWISKTPWYDHLFDQMMDPYH